MDTFGYEFLNEYNGRRTPTGRVECDYTTQYFMRSLYQRIISVIDFKIPSEWNRQYFSNVLFRLGYIAVIPTAKYGIIPQICTLSGFGIYREPKRVLVAQPLVQYEGDIGSDCEIIKLTPDYMGVWDIVEHYAVRLATAFTSLDVSLENSRLSVLLAAKDKAAAQTLKAIAEKISAGEKVIVYDKQLRGGDSLQDSDPIWQLSYDVKNNYITDKLLADISTLVSMFDREVGIPTVDEKRERMLTNEVTALTAGSTARLNTWKACLDESIGKVNSMFDLGISYTTIIDRLEVKQIDENNLNRNV